MELSEIKFDSPSALIFTLPEDLYNDLQIKVNSLNAIPTHKLRLAASTHKIASGEIEKAITLPVSESFNNFLVKLGESYSTFYKIKLKNNDTFKVSDVWANYQKKTEYTGLHYHEGLLSFVIWMKIPYDSLTEDTNNFINNKFKNNGRFNFVYNTYFGGISTKSIDLNQSYEGKGVIFPSKAAHMVYPFYSSDEYRISIAGNLA